MATWVSNGADTGGSGGYSPGTQSVQYLITNFASSGDVVTLPSGTFTWTTGVNVANAGGNLSITIQGNGYTPNTSTGNNPTGTTQGCGASPGAPTLFTVVSYAGGQNANPGGGFEAINSTGLPTTGKLFRITGINFTGITSSLYNYIAFGGSSSSDQFRIDNCLIDGGSGQKVLLLIYGNTISGVVDHCTFAGGGASEMAHNFGAGAGQIGGWTNDITPGGSQMIFYEDCIFQQTGYTSLTGQGGCSALQSYYGAQTVVRNCLLNFCQVDQHGTQGNIAARWWEFYNNTLFIPNTNSGNTSFYAIRGGSGVVYNNNVTGQTSAGFGISCNLYTDDTSSNTTYGTAPNFGPGAGIFKAGATQGPFSSPAYLWNNATVGVSTQIGSGGWNPSPILLNQNYYVSGSQPSSMLICEKASQTPGVTTYSYAPYTYPHPLTGLSTSPGSGLTAAADASIVKYTVGVVSGAYTVPTNLFLALFSTQFTNGAKAGATEWTTSSDPAYARTVMGANPTASWTIAAYASGTGVVFKNTNGIAAPTVTTNNQTCYSLGFCLASTVGVTDIQLYIDMPNNSALIIDIGYFVYLPALTGAIFTTE